MKRYQKNQCRLEPVCSRLTHGLRGGIILTFVVGASVTWQFSVGTPRGYSQPTEAVTPVTSSSLLQQGDEAFQRGAFEQAADTWQQSAQLAREAGNLLEESDAQVALAQGYVALGFHIRAAQELELAVALAHR